MLHVEVGLEKLIEAFGPSVFAPSYSSPLTVMTVLALEEIKKTSVGVSPGPTCRASRLGSWDPRPR